jgi:hypothetical protein
MVTPKIKVITARATSWPSWLEKDVQTFLNTLDIRQIVKIDYSATNDYYICSIIYLEMEDVRDMKISTLLDNKI